MDTVAGTGKQRQFPRVAVQGHLRYRRLPISAGGPHNALIKEIGRGGLKFRCDEPLNRKANLLLELHLPNSDVIRSLATVVWVKVLPKDDGFEIGGKFIEPTREARSTLEQIV